MKKVRLVIIIFISILALHLLSCSDDNPVDAGIYVPQFENQWRDEKDGDHTIQFTTFDDSLNRGLFRGREEYPDSGIFDARLLGSFVNRNLQFIVDRGSEIVEFSGSFVTDDRIELNSVKGRLVLIR